MKTKYYAVLLLLLCPIFAIGQNSVEYYQKIVDTTTNHELKLASLDSLAMMHKKAQKLDVSANYTEQFVAYALENEQYEPAIEMTISQFYMINTQLGQRERALKLIALVEPHIDKTDDSYYRGGVFLKKGGGYFNGKDYVKAIEYYTKAIELYSDKDSIYQADAIFFRGQAYFEIGNFVESSNNFNLASTFYENLGDKDYTFYTLASIISIYGINGFTEKAIEERDKMIQKKLKLDFLNGLSVDHYNQHSSYKKLGDLKKQEEYLLKALEYAYKEKNYLNNVDDILTGLSKFYSDKDLKKSKQYLDEAKKEIATVEKSTISYNNYEIAEGYYYAALGQNSKAIRIYRKALSRAKKSKDASKVMELNKKLSEAYDASGDYKNSNIHFKTYTRLKDSIFDRTKINALAFYQTLYETEKKEAKNLKQQNDIEVLAAQNENKRRLIIFGGIGLVLAFLIALLYRNRMYLKRKNLLQVNYSQNLLRSQDIERKRISKDLHDSLGQSLLLVKNKISKEDQEAKELLNHAIDEMRSISRTLYPNHLKQFGITSAISSLLEQLDENYPDTYIFGDVENIDGVLSTEYELNLFRIIQECLSNVIKHAKAESAKLELQKEKDKIVMTLQDNGIGFDFLTNFKSLKSLGLKTIKDRVKYINGILRVESSPGNGSKFKIEIQTI